MPDWGIDDEGVSTPSYSQILDYYAKRWEEEFGTQADLSSRSAEGQFLRVIAESLSNKGLPWSDITSIWDTIEDVYNSGFLETSSGTSLDHLVALRALTRNKPRPSEGVLIFKVDEGTEIPKGTTARTQSGIEFETIRSVTANRYGIAPVPAESVESNVEGNVIADTITESEEAEVSNPVDSHKLHIGSVIDGWETITNNEEPVKYQRLSVNDIKYSTNVDTLELTVKAQESGLYGIYFSILGFETGEEFYRTETKDQKLDEGEEVTLEFKGERFDFLLEDIEEDLRLAPMNAEYSSGDIDVALQKLDTRGGWFIGDNEQKQALYTSIISKVRGEFTGGRGRETDVELKNRYLNSLSRGGSTRPSAIESELYNVKTVKYVEILENSRAIDLRPEGLPPNSIEVIVWGGSREDILKAILNARPVGVNTWGDNVGVVEDEFGQVHNFRYSRAQELDTYVRINAVTTRTFPAGGGEEIKNICAEIIGGEDLRGTFHAGRVGVGDTLFQSELESALHDRVSGLKSVRAELGKSEDELADDDLEVGVYETPVTRPENIFISRGR